MSKHPLEQEYPLYAKIIAIIGVEQFVRLSAVLGGRYFRWPQLRLYQMHVKHQLISAARAEGKTLEQIGELVGMTRQGVHVALRRVKRLEACQSSVSQD